MTFLRDEIETMPREELEHAFRDLLDQWNSWEDYLQMTLGRETYIDMCKDWALSRSIDWLASTGMDEESVNEFVRMMQPLKDPEA